MEACNNFASVLRNCVCMWYYGIITLLASKKLQSGFLWKKAAEVYNLNSVTATCAHFLPLWSHFHAPSYRGQLPQTFKWTHGGHGEGSHSSWAQLCPPSCVHRLSGKRLSSVSKQSCVFSVFAFLQLISGGCIWSLLTLLWFGSLWLWCQGAPRNVSTKTCPCAMLVSCNVCNEHVLSVKEHNGGNGDAVPHSMCVLHTNCSGLYYAWHFTCVPRTIPFGFLWLAAVKGKVAFPWLSGMGCGERGSFTGLN